MTKFTSHFLTLVALSILVVPVSLAQRERTTGRQAGEADELIAITDVNERIKALEGFLKEKPAASKGAVDAREALVMSWAELASADLAENRIAPAMEHFQKAMAELPGEVSEKLFEETVARIPFVIARRGYREEGVTFARSLEKRFAKEPARLGAIGEFYLNVEAPLDAIRVLQAGLAIEKDNLRLRRPLATAYRMSLRLNEAAKELEQIIALDEKDPRALIELGNIARANGEYEQAMRYYRGHLKIEADSIAAYKGIALTAGAQKDNSTVEDALARVRTLKNQEEITNDIHLQTQFAFYLLGQGKSEEANVAIVNALTIEPRYSWARIAAAELDIAEGRIFEAEKHLLAALRTSDFPTLRFTLGKLYSAVEDFDGALEQFSKTFTVTKAGKFATRLGGVLQMESSSLDELLAPERQASIFVAKSLTTEDQYTMMESLVRFNAKLVEAARSKPSDTSTAQSRRTRTVPTTAEIELEAQIEAFVSVEGTRRPFRALYAAQRLSRAGVDLPLALKLADQVIESAETAVAEDGSLPEFPNYDRDGRLKVFRGRALDARGWALFQLRRTKEAIASLTEAVEAYGTLPEAKHATWRLATVKETVGEQKEALDLYIAGYEPPAAGEAADVKRSVIEALYKKVNGSLNGLDEKLGTTARSASATPPPTPKSGFPTNLKTDAAPPPVSLAPAPVSDSAQKSAPADLPVVSTSTVELASLKVTPAMKGSASRMRAGSSRGVPTPPKGPGDLPQTGAAPEGLRFATVRISRILLRDPVKRDMAAAPAPDAIGLETARRRRVSVEPEPTTRPRRIEKP